MDIRPVTETFAVSPQIEVQDVDALHQAGYTTIICNRPDREENGQPAVAQIEARAHELGLSFHHIPVTSGMLGPHHVQQMEAALDASQGKVLAYCRSGTRSVMLWAFQEVPKRPRQEIVQLAAKAGYDLSQQL